MCRVVIPAVIAKVRPRGVTLLALADQAVERSSGGVPVLVARPCNPIEGVASKVGERVRFLGKRRNDEMPGLLSSGDLAIFPSLMEATSVAATPASRA